MLEYYFCQERLLIDVFEPESGAAEFTKMIVSTKPATS
jgi:hypothetical protein